MFSVGIIGPESVGKSTLSQYLANRYNGTYIPEYAREYVEHLGRPYTYDDVCAIARKQIEDIRKHKQIQDSEKVAFFDTELIITRVWFDYCYGSTPDWVLEAMQRYKMDVYLLIYPDLPWLADPVRENGSEAIRKELFSRYEQEIQDLDVPYYIIRHV